MSWSVFYNHLFLYLTAYLYQSIMFKFLIRILNICLIFLTGNWFGAFRMDVQSKFYHTRFQKGLHSHLIGISIAISPCFDKKQTKTTTNTIFLYMLLNYNSIRWTIYVSLIFYRPFLKTEYWKRRCLESNSQLLSPLFRKLNRRKKWHEMVNFRQRLTL